MRLKSPEAMFVNLQSFDFRVERLPGNSEPGSRPGWIRDSALALCQSGFDHFSFALQARPVMLDERAGNWHSAIALR
jgi:hypothetical protein